MAYSVSSGTPPPASPVAPNSAEVSMVGAAAARQPLFFNDAMSEPSPVSKAAAGASAAVRSTGVGTVRKTAAAGGRTGLSAFLSALGLTPHSPADVRREREQGLEGLALRAVHLYGRSSGPSGRQACGGSFRAALSGLPDAEAAAELQREVQRLYLVSISHAFVDLCTQCSSLRPSAGIFSGASVSDFTPIDAFGSGSFDRSQRATEVSASGPSSPHDRRQDKPGPANGRVATSTPPSLTSSPIWGSSSAASPSKRGAGSAAPEPVINVAQMTQIVLGMHPLLELEEERFLPLFAQYKPDVGETAILEWGRLYLEQLAVTLRAHAAAATIADEKEKALLIFTDLWRAMRRLHRFGEGKIWPAAPLQAALSHLEPLLHVWVARDKELVLDHALAEIADDVARAGWVRAGGGGGDAGSRGGAGDRGGDGEAVRSTDGAAADAPHPHTVDTLFRALHGSDAVKGGWNPLFFLLPPPLARIALPALVSQFASALLSYCSLLTSGLPSGVPAEAVPAAARDAGAAAGAGGGWVGDEYQSVIAQAQMLRRRLHRQREALDAMRTFSPKEAVRDRSGYWGAFVVSLGLDSAAQRRCTALLDELNAHSLASLCVRAASASAVVAQLHEPHGLLAVLRAAAQHAEWEGPPPSAAFGDVRGVFGEAIEHIYEYIGVKVHRARTLPLTPLVQLACSLS
jgi:hypothetical protein